MITLHDQAEGSNSLSESTNLDIALGQPYIYFRHKSLDGNALGKVPREIDVQTLADCQPIGHQLQWDDVDKTLQAIDLLGHLDLVRLVRRELRVSGVADDDWATLSSNDLLVGIERLGENVIPSQDHDDWEVLVD